MNIKTNQEQFLEEMTVFKKDLIKVLSSENVERYREDYKGRYSPERFKEFFIEKTALHILFKYILIRIIEDSMGRVKVKLNQEGIKKWHQLSKNFKNDYNLLVDFAQEDVKREPDLAETFKETIYDRDILNAKFGNVLAKHIPILAKFDFSTLDENMTLTVIDKLYVPKNRVELQKFSDPSPIMNFLLQEVGLI